MKSTIRLFLFAIFLLWATTVQAVTVGSVTQKAGTALYAAEDWQVVNDSGSIAADTQDYTVTLAGDAVAYRTICVANITTAASWGLQMNGAGSGYGTMHVVGNNTAATSFRLDGTAYVYVMNDNLRSTGLALSDTIINAPYGSRKTISSKTVYGVSGTTVTQIVLSGGVYDSTSNLTSITFHGGQVNTFGPGSRFIVMARRQSGSEATAGQRWGTVNVKGQLKAGVWQLVEQKNFTSAATSYSFNGLDGNNDTLYNLKIRKIGGAAVAGTVTVQFNNDTTNGNYGDQSLNGIVTTVSALRYTGTGHYTGGLVTAITALHQSDTVIYAKSGGVRPLLTTGVSNVLGAVPGSISTIGGAWNNTTANVVSIQVTDTQTNGLGVNSTAELWKLNLGN